MFISDKVKNQTTAYAKDELTCYLSKMAGLHNLARIELMLINPEKDDKMDDDRYIIDITNGKGTIQGSNSRSILLGVYAYLKSLGCRFLRPGKNGEIVPKSDLTGECKLDLTAFYPYRIEVMEGAINDDIVIETLKWLPKAGYNGYFIQFVTPYVFLNRWHSHELNPYKTPEEFSWDEAEEETQRIERYANLLGLQLWTVCHAYMFIPFGMNYGPEWKTKLSEEAKPHVALIDGKRVVRGGNINYTNLCYTDPVVKEKVSEFFVDYLTRKPYVDVVSVGLADGIKNDCECDRCVAFGNASDAYVELLNAIDEALTKAGINTKIELSLYVSTMWAPTHARFNNPDRFIMDTAASRGGYEKSYSLEKHTEPLKEFDRKVYYGPKSFSECMHFFDEWQKVTNCTPVIWDYHLYSQHYFDFAGYMKFSKTIAGDCVNLGKLGMKGILNCKTQRAFMPTGLPTYTFGEMLVDPEINYQELKNDYFKSAFGGLAKETEEYLTQLGDLIDMKMLKVKTDVAATGGTTADTSSTWAWRNNPDAAALFAEVPNAVDGFMEKVNEYLKTEENETIKRSFQILYYHGEIIKRFAKALYLGAINNREECDTAVVELKNYIMQNEDEYLLEFDSYLFVRRFINEVVFRPGT